MRTVYLAHPISGDVGANVHRVLLLSEEVFRKLPDHIPFAPYLLALAVLSEGDYEDRDRGISANREYFRRKAFDELWICGDSEGVKQETQWADHYGIKIVDRQFWAKAVLEMHDAAPD